MTTFNETLAPTFRKYVDEQGIVMPNWSKTFQTFWPHSSDFALEKQPKKLNFQRFLNSKRPFGGYFQWNAYSYFQRIVMPNGSKTSQSFWSYSSVFALEKQPKKLNFQRFFDIKKQPKKLNFQRFFTSKRPFGGYFQWNACGCFQKICSWTRYSNAKLIKNISISLVALLHFCFIKTT